MTGYENDEASAQLTSRVKPGVVNYNIGCDALGNIVTKSDLNIPDAVTLNYGNTTNPHALTSITGKPDAIPSDSLEVSYTDFRKIKMLSEGAKQYSITYGVDDQRRRTDYTTNEGLMESGTIYDNWFLTPLTHYFLPGRMERRYGNEQPFN